MAIEATRPNTRFFKKENINVQLEMEKNFFERNILVAIVQALSHNFELKNLGRKKGLF